MRLDRPQSVDCTGMPKPEAIELPRATYLSPRPNADASDVVVVRPVVDEFPDSLFGVDDVDVSLEQPLRTARARLRRRTTSVSSRALRGSSAADFTLLAEQPIGDISCRI